MTYGYTENPQDQSLILVMQREVISLKNLFQQMQKKKSIFFPTTNNQIMS